MPHGAGAPVRSARQQDHPPTRSSLPSSSSLYPHATLTRLEAGADPNVPYRDRDDCYRETRLLDRVQGSPEPMALLEEHGAV